MERDRVRLAELLHVASRLPAAERESFLARAEPRRPDLRAEVLSLASHDLGCTELAAAGVGEVPRTGPWVLLEPLGEAPPARLFRARRRAAPGRRAVLAVLDAPGAAASIAAALDRQARGQAELDHPRLARLVEAASPDGRWVHAAFDELDGIPLAQLCDALRLPVPERMRLVEDAAHVVAHAHARGVCPLGLLPWSVLATWAGGAPRAALLVFDPWPLLAVLDPDARPRPDVLAALETSAPEALRGEPRGAHTDVFALGALAFELATGTLPLGLRELVGRRSLREELRLASTVRAPLASERLAALGPEAGPAAAARGTTVRGLARELRGSLDSLLARAMDPDPRGRPASAADLADQLARWRDARPAGRRALESVQRLARRLGRGRRE